MGKLISVMPNEVRPSQDFLKEGTIKFILECIFSGNEEKLPPAPMVRFDRASGCYIAIDGHNLLAVSDLLGRPCDVYVAEHANDTITLNECPNASIDALKQRNADLRKKFDGVIKDIINLEKVGINSFRDLRMRYGYTSNLEMAKAYFLLK